MSEVLYIIPSRLHATRLPHKPLALIGNQPLIVHVWQQVKKIPHASVVVACGDKEIAQAIEEVGGQAVLTDPTLPSGSDRIYEALKIIDPQEKYKIIVNVQGDLPFIESEQVIKVVECLKSLKTDISTLATLLTNKNDQENPDRVKIALTQHHKALYFSRRCIPYGDGPIYYHIGIYAFQRKSLEKFVKMPPSLLEKREKLEQLRALEAGMSIGVGIVDSIPLGVDTPQDLEKAREFYKNRTKNNFHTP
jgi:3-deoxy-manno-octulosonate cytidylyltransferase (CMP-KDO synthetase)